MVDQWKIMVEQWNSRTVEQIWWNSGTVMENSGTDMVEQWNRDGGTVEQ